MSDTIGVNLSINLDKIDESKLFISKKGERFLNLTTFINSKETSQYGDHGMISQQVDKETRDRGAKGAVLGNAKVFWSSDNSHARQERYQGNQQVQQHSQPQHSQPQHSQPQHSQPQQSQPQHSQPQHSQPQHSQPQHSQPQQSQPQHSQPQHSQPQHSQPQQSQPQHSQPQQSQPQKNYDDFDDDIPF